MKSIYGRGSPIREAQVLNPANMFAIADAQLNKSGVNPYFPQYSFARTIGQFYMSLTPIPPEHYGSDQGYPVGLADGLYQRRHNTKFNVLSCDGHVEMLRISQMFTSRSDDVLARWNNDNQPHREVVGYPGW